MFYLLFIKDFYYRITTAVHVFNLNLPSRTCDRPFIRIIPGTCHSNYQQLLLKFCQKPPATAL